MGTGSFPRGKSGRGLALTTHPQLCFALLSLLCVLVSAVFIGSVSMLSNIIVCVCVLHGLFIFSVILQHASLETEDSSLSQIAIEAQYKDRVTQQLQEIKTMLCHLFPLNFRCVRKYLLWLMYIPNQAEIHSYFLPIIVCHFSLLLCCMHG